MYVYCTEVGGQILLMEQNILLKSDFLSFILRNFKKPMRISGEGSGSATLIHVIACTFPPGSISSLRVNTKKPPALPLQLSMRKLRLKPEVENLVRLSLYEATRELSDIFLNPIPPSPPPLPPSPAGRLISPPGSICCPNAHKVTAMQAIPHSQQHFS